MRMNTFRFYHNLEPACDMGDRFAQDIEPHGYYLGFHDSTFYVPGHEYGTVTFKKPYVLEWKTAGFGGWKTDLSDAFGNLIGEELTQEMLRQGYDGVITMDHGQIFECVSFKPDENLCICSK